MNQRRVIFFTILGVYHAFVLAFTIYMDTQQENSRFLFAMLRNFPLFKYAAGFGLLLFVIDWIWSWIANRSHKKEMEELGKEKNALKARVYDMQEEVKELNAKLSQTPPPAES